MTSPTLDESLIGPLSSSRIGDSPQRWGAEPTFRVSDSDAERSLQRDVARRQAAGRNVLLEEFRGLCTTVRQGGEPRNVLHGLLIWGPIGEARLAGYLGVPVSDVCSRLRRLEGIGLVQPVEQDELGDAEYAVNLEAQALQPDFWTLEDA